jgi:hypothetical protein
MKIACRWPGGIDLLLVRTNAPNQTIKLAGPKGSMSVLPPFMQKGRPSRNAATLTQTAMADTVKTLMDTVSDEYDPRQYGVTEVPYDFWNAWFALNRDNDIVVYDMVFSLEG